MQRRQLGRDHVHPVALVAESGCCRDRELLCIVEARVEEDAFAVHFQVRDNPSS
jgi:hypothetical protein